jgi:hypothetical protein
MTRLLAVFLAFLILVFMGLIFCTAVVPLDRVGVRSNLLGQGVEQRDLAPGLWLVIPFVHKLDILDPTLQRLNFQAGDQATAVAPRGVRLASRQIAMGERDIAAGETEGVLRLRTKDQYETAIDMTIFYRIRDGKAHLVLRSMGPGYSFRERFRQQAEAEIWKVMGGMKTEDFYASEIRTQKSKETVERLNQALEAEKIELEVVSVLVRKVVFDPRFEEKLIAKQLLDQQRLLAESQTLREKEQQKTELIHRETDAKALAIETQMKQDIVTLKTQTDAQMARIKADADLQVRTLLTGAGRAKREMTAEGEKLKEIARARGEEALNKAYGSPGGRLVLSRKFIQNLEIGPIILNTNQTNPFDVEKFLRMVGAQGQ